MGLDKDYDSTSIGRDITVEAQNKDSGGQINGNGFQTFFELEAQPTA